MFLKNQQARAELMQAYHMSTQLKESLDHMNDMENVAAFQFNEGDVDVDVGNTEPVEMASMDRALDASNKGYQLLLKMGWKENTGLGKNGTGKIEPIRIELKDDSKGMGRKELDEEYVNPDNIKRKLMEYEKEETEELKQKRKLESEQIVQRKKDVENITESFYCKLCNKRYKRISEYEGHLSSYDHNHTKRLAEVKEMNRRLKSGIKTRKKKEDDPFAAVLKRANAVNPNTENDSNTLSPVETIPSEPHEPVTVNQKTSPKVESFEPANDSVPPVVAAPVAFTAFPSFSIPTATIKQKNNSSNRTSLGTKPTTAPDKLTSTNPKPITLNNSKTSSFTFTKTQNESSAGAPRVPVTFGFTQSKKLSASKPSISNSVHPNIGNH